ncbi:MAG: hypothetical protein ACK4VK_01670 [Aquificaceae bacterium]
MTAKRLNLYIFLISLLLFGFALDRYHKLRDSYYEEYLRYKEVMLLLNNYQTRQKATIEENFIRQSLSQVGADPLSFKQAQMGYEIKARNLRGENIPRLIYSLESQGIEILGFKAVDNTGQGFYEVELRIR